MMHFSRRGVTWIVVVAAVLGWAACGDDDTGNNNGNVGRDAALGDGNVVDAGPGQDGAVDGAPGDGNVADAGPGQDGAVDAAQGDAAVDGGNPSAPVFEDVHCLPDVTASPPESLVDGQMLQCTFRVTGPAGASVTLSCQDDSGSPIDCSSTSVTTQIQPFGVHSLPVENGWFGSPSDGMGGQSIVVVWVADDGQGNIGTYRLEAPVIPDDGINQPPSLELDCGGDTDGDVDVTAGQELLCRISVLDPDPDQVRWDYVVQSGSPANTPHPAGGLGGVPYAVDWRWQTEGSEAGSTVVFRFSADDSNASMVTYDLTVHVL